MLIAAIALVLLVAQEPLVTPSPQPSPLKQIIEVKARALCTTMGKNVQVALVGLMKNDQNIEAGRKEFEKLAWDQAQGSHAIGVDRLAIKNVVDAMVHNLAAIDQVLDDPSRFPTNPGNDDERSADRVKAALQAVEDQQKMQINILNGTVETDELSDMRHGFPAFNPSVNNPRQSSVPTAAPSTIYDAGVQAQPKAAATAAPQTYASNSDLGVAATSPGASFAQALQHGQDNGTMLESEASAIIVPIADECRAEPPTQH